MTINAWGREGPKLRSLALLGWMGGAGLVGKPTKSNTDNISTVLPQRSKAACSLAKTGEGAGPEGNEAGTRGKVVLSINKYLRTFNS